MTVHLYPLSDCDPLQLQQQWQFLTLQQWREPRENDTRARERHCKVEKMNLKERSEGRAVTHTHTHTYTHIHTHTYTHIHTHTHTHTHPLKIPVINVSSRNSLVTVNHVSRPKPAHRQPCSTSFLPVQHATSPPHKRMPPLPVEVPLENAMPEGVHLL